MSAIKSGSIKLTSNELSDVKVRLYGNTAIVTGRSHAKGSIGNGSRAETPPMSGLPPPGMVQTLATLRWSTVDERDRGRAG